MPLRSGKLVTNGDVIPFAKKACKTCFGRGEFNIMQRRFVDRPNGKKVEVPARAPKKGKDASPRESKLCGCGLLKFAKVKKGLITMDGNNQLHWLEEVPEVVTTGAVGDGIADDTKAIQAAIDSVGADSDSQGVAP